MEQSLARGKYSVFPPLDLSVETLDWISWRLFRPNPFSATTNVNTITFFFFPDKRNEIDLSHLNWVCIFRSTKSRMYKRVSAKFTSIQLSIQLQNGLLDETHQPVLVKSDGRLTSIENQDDATRITALSLVIQTINTVWLARGVDAAEISLESLRTADS